MFTREDLTDEQRLFGQTAAEFMRNEVLPERGAAVRARLGSHARAAAQGGRAGSAAARDPAKPTAASASTRSARRMSASRSPSTRRLPGRSARTPPSARCRSSTSATTRRRRRYLPRLASGELHRAPTRSPSRSRDPTRWRRSTTAALSDDGRHYLLNGQKMWITNGGFADLFTIFAKVNGEKFTAFLVERGDGRGERAATRRSSGLDGSSTTALMLDNVRCRWRTCSARSAKGTRSRSTSSTSGA